jgi:hypothetical protein
MNEIEVIVKQYINNCSLQKCVHLGAAIVPTGSRRCTSTSIHASFTKLILISLHDLLNFSHRAAISVLLEVCSRAAFVQVCSRQGMLSIPDILILEEANAAKVELGLTQQQYTDDNGSEGASHFCSQASKCC